MSYIKFERGDRNTARVLDHSPSAQPCSSVIWEQNGYYAAKDVFAFVSSLKLSRRLLCSVHFVFVSTANLQRGRAFVVGITNLSKEAVCVKAKAPADHVYHRRTWDEFKRVLSVAHTSQPVERAENLEYRNQLSGVCWGAVYCSIEAIFFNYVWRRIFVFTNYIFTSRVLLLLEYPLTGESNPKICWRLRHLTSWRKLWEKG